MNVFDQESGAASYERGRPYFHPSVIRRLASLLPSPRVRTALDLACGTGQSTEALLSISDMAVGLDPSEPMLRHRRQGQGRYVSGVAEQLPFRSGTFELVSVALALHWFDRTAALHEAHRVLAQGSWLLIYDSGFCMAMRENASFVDWIPRYRERFPAPPRNVEPFTPEFLRDVGFREEHAEEFLHLETYDVEGLISYLMTQSNVLSALREGGEAERSAQAWLRRTLTPILEGMTGTFEYRGWLRLLQKTT